MNTDTDNLMQTYKRLPISFVRGEGVWLWDEQGNRYLDALGGIAVAALGHSNPVLAEALADQARTLIHTSNIYRIPMQEALGSKLCEISGMSRVFFCNSGAEANEAAIKIARRYGHSKDIEVPTVLVTDGSFHGRTLATLTATGNPKVHAGFEPLVSGFKRVPFDDPAAIRRAADPSVVAVLVEPVQGEGGINVPRPGYLSELREICDENQWLLITDEIQTGMGRTGKWFAYQHDGIQPDVATIAKALGNGIPIGACLAHGGAGELLTAGSHGTTFGGNPFACRAALTVLDQIEERGLVKRAAELGSRLQKTLAARLRDEPKVVSVRGIGMMLAIELDRPCSDLVAASLEQGLLINVTADNVVRLLPPLIISDEEADLLVDRMLTVIRLYQ